MAIAGALLHTVNVIVIVTKTHGSELTICSKGLIRRGVESNISMPTHDIISYEMDVLNAMNVDELLIQLIARKDLERPTRENDLKLDLARQEIRNAVIEVMNDLNKLNLGEFAVKVKDVYNIHFHEIEADKGVI